MAKVRNAVMAIVFAVFIAGPALILAAGVAHVPLPSWFTAEDAKELSGGVVHGDIAGNLSVRGFAEGDLQEAIENVVGNRIPCKAAAMLGNASLQRSAIAASNLLFGWECYPTHFGSGRLYIPAADADTFLPDDYDKKFVKRLKVFAKGVKKAAKRHPGKRFVVYLVPGYATPDYNPAYALRSNPKTAQDAIDVFSDVLSGIDNLFFLTDPHDSAESYYTDFYHTDHHWTYRGAQRAYNTMASALGLAAFESPGEIDFGDFRFSGSTARAGLDTTSEAVYDTSFDFSKLTVVDSQGRAKPYGHDTFFEASDQEQRYDFYTKYYNFMETGTTIENEGAKGEALLISDSYRGGIQHYIGLQYATTTISVHLHESKNHSKITERSRLDNVPGFAEAEDVYFVACPQNMAKLIKNCHDYFEKA